MKLYLKWLFSGKLKTYGLSTISSINYKFLSGRKGEVAEFDKNTSIAKSLVFEALASSVVVARSLA